MAQTIYAQQSGNWSDNVGSGTWWDSPSGGTQVNGPTSLSDWDGDTIDLNGHTIAWDADVVWNQTLTVQDSSGLNGTALTVGWGGYNTPTVWPTASLTLSPTAGLYIVAMRGTVTVYGSFSVAGSLQCDWSGALVITYAGNATILSGGNVNIGNGDPPQYFGWGDRGPASSITVDDGGTLAINHGSNVVVQEGAIEISQGGNMLIDGIVTLCWYGSLTINGAATVESDGELDVGGALGGTLSVGAYSWLIVGGTLSIASNGTLSIDPTAAFAIQPGATLDFTVNASSGAMPSPSDVRNGVAIGTATGTCYVPPPSAVALGVPVDATANATALGFPSGTQPTGVANLSDGLLGTGNPLNLVTGDDYLYTDGRAVLFGVPSGSIDLTTAASFALEVCEVSGGLPSGSISVTITGQLLTGPFTIAGQTFEQALQFQPTAAQTDQLYNWHPAAYSYRVRAFWTSPSKTVTVVLPTPASATW